MATIVHKFLIEGTREKIYQAITTQEGLSNWWTKDCVAEPTIGSVAEFYFHNRRGGMKMEIKELTENDSIAWNCIEGHDEWVGTTLNFTFGPHERGTMVTFKHDGWQSIDGGYGHCTFDWARYFLSLRSYVETGQGQPHEG